MIASALKIMHATGVSRLAETVSRGCGVILTLHHVLPNIEGGFQPNKLLAISPDFLEQSILLLRKKGFEIISLDEAANRIETGAEGKPFAVLTFDDAYRDVRDNALPILRKHNCPATIYVVSSFASGMGFMWWRALETALASLSSVTVDLGQGPIEIPTRTDEEKHAAWNRIYWFLRGGPEDHLRAAIASLSAQAGYNCEEDCRAACLSWEELRAVAADPLVTIGAHTVRHYMLGKWPLDVARSEIVDNRADIERELSLAVDHLAYPVGDPVAADTREFELASELGFRTAVTTRPDHIRARHHDQMTALPRVSLNGLFQKVEYLDVLLSGLPFALRSRLKRN